MRIDPPYILAALALLAASAAAADALPRFANGALYGSHGDGAELEQRGTSPGG